MSKNTRTRHTASYRLSHFLNSKESLELSWFTGNLVSIIRYIYDVMDMNYNQIGQEIFNKSYAQTALYSRTSRSTIRRAFEIFVKNDLLTVISRERRKVSVFGCGKLISSRFTTNLDLSTDEDSRFTMNLATRFTTNLALGSPRTTSKNSCKKESKTEREQRALSPSLSHFFEPDEESLFLCKDLGLNLVDEVKSFEERHNGKKSQYEFQRWLKMSKEYQVTKKSRFTTNQANEPYSAVNRMPFHQSADTQEAVKRDTTPEPVKIEKLPSFREQLKIYKQQGVKPNGKDVSTGTTRNNSG